MSYLTILALCGLLWAAGAAPAGEDYIVVEDFSSTSPGELPRDWTWRAQDEKKPKLYQVQSAGGRHYLAARDTGSSVILGKHAHWDPQTHPIMTWCWKVNALPPGGDERYDRTNDSAAGVYVIFSTNWLGVPRQIKYVWSSTLPVGTTGRRNKVARPYFVVVESGAQHLGKWTFAQVDLFADHQRLYGKAPPDRTVGMGILTDANSTRSYAEAYYADLRVWTRQAQEQGLIEDYCGCFEETAPEGLPDSAYQRSSSPAGERGGGVR